MAVVPVIIGWGNSNWDGIAPVSTVPASDFARWFSVSLPASDFPFEGRAPGVRVLTPRMPFAAASTRDIGAVGANTVTMSSAVAGTTVDRWIYVLENATGQGQHRQITANPATATPTVSPNWAPALTASSGQVQVLGSSHTAAAAGSTTVINKSANTAAFTSAAVGHWLVGLSGANAGVARKIVGFNSATQVTCEAFPSAFTAGDGMRVLDGAASVEGLSSLTQANCALQDLIIYYDFANSYSTGLEYPNFKSYPRSCPNQHKGNQFINLLPELTWQMRSRFEQRLCLVSLGISASTISPLYSGATFAASEFSWGHDVTHLDFHPASPNGLFQALDQAIVAACELIKAEGNTPDVVLIVGTPAENDAGDANRAAAFRDNLELIRDTMRRRIYDRGYARRKPDQIPFIVTNLKPSVQTYATVTNQAMADMATSDSRTGVVDTSDATFVSGLHFDAPFYITLGKRIFSTWETIFDRDNYANRAIANRPTLAAMRSAVRSRYERSTQSNDAKPAQINSFLNDSLREVYNTLGDIAWFLRRAEVATIESGLHPATISLDAHMARPLRIESQANPGRALVWKGISHTSNLRTQITLFDVGCAPYVVHFIQIPRDLVNDDDVTVMPEHYIELPVMLTCKRLSESVGNSSLAMYYAAECERLWRMVKRDCQRYDRMRQETMATVDCYDTLRNSGPMPDSWYL